MGIKASTIIESAAKGLLNLVYPARCAACGEFLEHADRPHICGKCASEIRQNPKPWCERCGRSQDTTHSLCPECRKIRHNFDRAYSACIYEGALKNCIHRFKYKGKLRLAEQFAELITDFINSNPEALKGFDAVSFVPLSNRKNRERGYNQSEVLAGIVSKKLGLPLLDALVKTKSTRPQSELNRNSRLENVKGSFGARRGAPVKGKNILIVDDVLTTGSTIDECARVLSVEGADSICAFTLARGA